MSIYETTKQKLITHGVQRTDDGSLTLRDKKLFLLFVALERARQLKDFDAILRAVARIDDYLRQIGKRHLLLFAYMYIRFSEFTPKRHEMESVQESGEIRHIKSYAKKLSQEEIAIGEWALAMYDRYEQTFFRAIYSTRKMSRIKITAANFHPTSDTKH